MLSARNLGRILRSTKLAAFASDTSCRIVALNSSAASVLGWSAREALGRSCFEILHPQDAAEERDCCARAGQAPCPARRAIAARHVVEPFALLIRHGRAGAACAEITLLQLSSGDRRERVFLHIMRLNETADRHSGSADTGGTAPDPLSPREIEVLGRLIAGATVKDLSFDLSITLATARAHVRSILRKLEVHRQIDAVLAALRRGRIPRTGTTASV